MPRVVDCAAYHPATNRFTTVPSPTPTSRPASHIHPLAHTPQPVGVSISRVLCIALRVCACTAGLRLRAMGSRVRLCHSGGARLAPRLPALLTTMRTLTLLCSHTPSSLQQGPPRSRAFSCVQPVRHTLCLGVRDPSNCYSVVVALLAHNLRPPLSCSWLDLKTVQSAFGRLPQQCKPDIIRRFLTTGCHRGCALRCAFPHLNRFI